MKLMNQLPFMIALLPCGLRNAFKELFYERFPEYLNDCCEDMPQVMIEGNLNYEKTFYASIDEMTDSSALPDIFISSDINALHHQHFIKNLLNDTYFDALQISTNSMYAKADYPHPEGLLTMLPPNLLIMVVDTRAFLPEELPSKWEDLLRLDLAQKIVFRGDSDFFCNAVFFPFVKEYGYTAVKRLAQNTLTGLHPAEMIKMINADNTGNASIFVMPYSFALKIRKTENFKIVWPSDGAIVSPVQMLIKKGSYEKYKEIIDFINCKEMGLALASTGFPSTHQCVENEGKPIKWLGWDYIYNNDIKAIKRETQEAFFSAYKKPKKESSFMYVKE